MTTRGQAGRFPVFLLGSTFLLLAALTWRKWPDLLIDFGAQLYIPWRISEGERMYRDIVYVFGPLSQYFHAGLMSLFGPSYSVIIAANLFLIALETWLLFILFRQLANQLAATAAGVCFLAAFGFAQMVPIGNYNFASPYAHEATHGIVLATFLFLALLRVSQRRSALWAVAAGLAFGATALTKQEVFASAAAAVLVWAVLEMRRGPGQSNARLWLAFLAPALAVTAAAWGAIAVFTGPSSATRGLSEFLRIALDPRIAGMPLYLGGMGLNQPVLNLILMLLVTGVWVLAAWILYRLAVFRDQGLTSRYRWLAALGAALTLALPWALSGACLLPAALVILYRAVAGLPRTAGPEARLWIVWSVFALALLPRMFLAPRIFHYGFYLGMPAFILLAVFLTHHVPESLPLSPGAKMRYRRLAAAFLLLGMARLTATSQLFFYSRKTVDAGRGGDRIRAYDDRQTRAVRTLLEAFDRSVPPGASLAVLPEGAMLNYLGRRANPTGYLNLTPLVTAAYGEDSILAAFRRRPPGYVVVFPRDTAEFGVGPFGRDSSYGRAIREWVEREYTAVFRTGPSGAVVWKRR